MANQRLFGRARLLAVARKNRSITHGQGQAESLSFFYDE
jgi:hypothetical protein